MIAFINGILASLTAEEAVIDVGGVGYAVRIAPSTAERIGGIGEVVRLHTYLSVREDGMTLYGFLSREERTCFEQLITVSGVGPKGALGILSVLGVDDLRFAILSGDAKTISRAPGIGKKTADRLILELRDKMQIDPSEVFGGGGTGEADATAPTDHPFRDEAVEVMVALGYHAAEAMRAVRIAAKDNPDADTETLVKAALKEMI